MIFLKYHFDGFLQTAVEAVNDGKIASWEIHRYLQVAIVKKFVKILVKMVFKPDTNKFFCQGLHGNIVSEAPQLPKFHTAIDEVDISVEVV